MPKGRVKHSHKGRAKRYQTAEEIREQDERQKREAEWKRKKGLPGDEGKEEGEHGSGDEGAVGRGEATPRDMPPGSSEEEEEEESSEEDAESKPKGVEGLIDVENPNRVAGKMKKVKDIDVHAKVELSRREREEIQRQRDATNYRKMHEAGRTDEAMRDMARLAIIRQQREELAKKREAEKKAKETAQTSAREKQLQQQKNRAK